MAGQIRTSRSALHSCFIRFLRQGERLLDLGRAIVETREVAVPGHDLPGESAYAGAVFQDHDHPPILADARDGEGLIVGERFRHWAPLRIRRLLHSSLNHSSVT